MNKKVLIVDDEPDIAGILDAYLQREGYRTAIVHDGIEAVERYLNWRPDLVLLDTLLPGRSGGEVLSIIRQGGDTPVIMVTAIGGEYDKIGAQPLAVHAGLSKRYPTPRTPCGTSRMRLTCKVAK
jgi:two-component system response regulator AdeR